MGDQENTEMVKTSGTQGSEDDEGEENKKFLSERRTDRLDKIFNPKALHTVFLSFASGRTVYFT